MGVGGDEAEQFGCVQQELHCDGLPSHTAEYTNLNPSS